MGPLMGQILSEENITESYKHVCSNLGKKTSRKYDDLTQREVLAQWMSQNMEKAKGDLLRGSYCPDPVRKILIDKTGGGQRELGIPELHDRLIQQSICQVISPLFDKDFSKYSYGYRPGRNCHQAVFKAVKYISAGNIYVAELDIECFFDHINHGILRSEMLRGITDARVMTAIFGFLRRGYIKEGYHYAKKAPHIGIYQGDPISPLLANIYLNPLDKELEEKDVPFIRYADDIKCFRGSPKAGRRLISNITKDLERKFKVRVNQEKSRVIPYAAANIFGFTITMKDDTPIIHLSSKAEDKYILKLQEIIDENQEASKEEMMLAINSFIRGWVEYYKIIDDPQPLIRLDEYTKEVVTNTYEVGHPVSVYSIYREIHTSINRVA